jgi:hypothetical protein
MLNEKMSRGSRVWSSRTGKITHQRGASCCEKRHAAPGPRDAALGGGH